MSRLSAVKRMAVGVVAGLIAMAGAPPASAADELSIVTKYAPFIYLAPGEPFKPMNASTFVAQSSLSWAHDESCGDHNDLAERTKIDVGKLGSGGYQHQNALPICVDSGAQHRSDKLTRPRKGGKDGVQENEGFFLNFPNEQRTSGGSGAPVYYDYSSQRYVTYWFFYPFNDAKTAAFDHEGDWERISIQLDSRDNALTVAYYYHGHYCTRSWAEAGKHNGHPLAYSSVGTHATYPKAGSHPRLLLGAGTDTTGRGDPWATYTNLVKLRTQGWFGFGGAWGEIGERSDSTAPAGPRFQGAAPTDWNKNRDHCP